jgi:DNA-directed RNA polymerase specialized sigma24 family protein
MEPGERELRELFKRARLTLSFDDQPSEKVVSARDVVSSSALVAVANLAAVRAVQLYAETHPRPTQVSQAQAAEMLGVHPKTVRNYIVAGKLKLNGCGQIPIEAVDKIRSAGRSWA